MSTDPSQPDLAWRGYSGFAMAPSFVICGILSAVLLIGRLFFAPTRDVVEETGSWPFFTATWTIWIVQLFRWLYREATYIYRLTPQALYVDRGFLYNPELPVELAKVTKVEWGANWLGRYLGVGWVAVASAGRERQLLTGVWRPAAFAEEIEAARKKLAASLPRA